MAPRNTSIDLATHAGEATASDAAANEARKLLLQFACALARIAAREDDAAERIEAVAAENSNESPAQGCPNQIG